MANREQRRASDFDVKAYIKASNEIEGIYSEQENAQSLAAWAYLDKLETLSHLDICTVQKLITINQQDLRPNQRGYYRNVSQTNVQVGGRVAADYSYVEDLMIKWLNDIAEMTPLVGHIRFEAIHPFVDGNGRTGRMLYWFVCKRRGIKPYRYNADSQKDREAYYRLFNQKLVIKLSNLNWRLRDEDMLQKEEDKPVKFVATMAMQAEHITPLFDTEQEVYDYLKAEFGVEEEVDGEKIVRIDYDDYDIFGLDKIDLQIMDGEKTQ